MSSGRAQICRRRRAGFTLFELLVVCALVGVLATLALNRLWDLQEEVERVVAEQTVGALKNALRIRAAELMTAARWDEFRKLPGSNPFAWMEEPPSNYGGELGAASAVAGTPGFWYFDRVNGALVYYVKRAAGFRAGDGSRIMRFAVVGVDAAGRPTAGPSFAWVGLRARSEYLWLGKLLR